ncbi:hypothetical protein BJ742DRAFT_900708 [Cladochytrium replicatum]|nr:hypothetical protein BJ742DRAFT_900708 [Cladochytrium replicatum]
MASPLTARHGKGAIFRCLKKDFIAYIHENTIPAFLRLHKLNGKPARIVKAAKRDALDAAYLALIAGGDDVCRKEVDSLAMDAIASVKEADEAAEKPVVEAFDEVPKFTKQVLKKGTGEKPKNGHTATCFYIGYQPEGKTFDTNNDPKKKKPVPPVFKLGVGWVIRGEKAKLVKENEWAYGKKAPENTAGHQDDIRGCLVCIE